MKVKILSTTIIIMLIMIVAFWLIVKPKNNREWTDDQKVLSSAEIKGNEVTIHQIRNFRYRSETDYDARYDDRRYNLDDLRSVDFIVVPFKESQAAAHTFVSFGFADSAYLAISIEIRKEKGEAYSVWKGLFRNFEIMYVIGDENDLIKLRTHFRRDDVYLYPVKTTPEKLRAMFLGMLYRANQLYEKPEFYNSLWNNCTSNLVSHVNEITPQKIPFSFKRYLPGYSDELAFRLGLIDTDLPWQDVRPHFRISEKALNCGDCPDFSKRIRGFE